MQILIKGFSWALVCYVLYCGLLFVVQRRLIYPVHLLPPTPMAGKIDPRIERIWLSTHDERVEAWFMPTTASGSGKPAPAIILAHGNAERIDDLAPEFDWLTAEGFALLFVEYPGYGRSEGSPTQGGITETLLAAYDLLVQRAEIDPQRIVLFGRSLGGGTICTLADNRPSAGLILISTFTDMRRFAIHYLAPGFLVRDVYDNRAVLKRYEKPVLLLHGKHDEVIPYAHALELARSAKAPTLITYNCGHNDCPPDSARFRRDILSFLEKIGVPAVDRNAKGR